MASINQLISEIANALQQPTNVPLREAIRLSIIHNRARLIRHSFEQHNIIDKVLQQSYKVTLIDCPEGDLQGTDSINIAKIKRSEYRVSVPIRLINGLPFLSVRTAGVTNPIEIAYATQPAAKYYKSLPGFCNNPTYDFINGYIYIFAENHSQINIINSIIVESAFEQPLDIPEEHFENVNYLTDDDEFIISEDMIADIKKLVMEEVGQRIFETNEIPESNLVK